MRNYLLGLVAILFLTVGSVSAKVIPVHLEWDAPTTNEDGTPATDLSHYVLYACDQPIPDTVSGQDVTCPGNMVEFVVPGDQTTTIADYNAPTGEGIVYFRATAWDDNDNESLLSNQVSYEYDVVAPTGITIRLILK